MECQDYVDKEFIVERPEGYEPRYLRASTKRVAFALPGGGAGEDDGVARALSSGSEDASELSEGAQARREAGAEDEQQAREGARKQQLELAR